jgi:hypothetical protein
MTHGQPKGRSCEARHVLLGLRERAIDDRALVFAELRPHSVRCRPHAREPQLQARELLNQAAHSHDQRIIRNATVFPTFHRQVSTGETSR